MLAVFNAKRKLIKENLELKRQLDWFNSMEKERAKVETVSDIIALTFNDFLYRDIQKEDISNIKIIPTMKLSNGEDGLLGIWYGVEVLGYDDSDSEPYNLCEVPIHFSYDGGFNSPFANGRRKNMYDLTLSTSEFIKAEIERFFFRNCREINVEIISNQIESLIKQKNGD